MAVSIPDRNLKFALISALVAESLLPRPELAALSKKLSMRPSDGGYNERLAKHFLAMPIEAEQLARLTKLFWSEKTIHFVSVLCPDFTGEGDLFAVKDLSGLEHCVGLVACHLNAMSETMDIGVFAQLTQLQRLYLSCEVRSLEPFANLLALESLAVTGPLVDLSSLRSMAALKDLELGGLRAVDLAPLADLARLERLRLAWDYRIANSYRYGGSRQGFEMPREPAASVIGELAGRGVNVGGEWPWGAPIQAGASART